MQVGKKLIDNMNKLDMTIIIPTLNRSESLKRTIKFICQQQNIPAQIVVIDQSPDEKMQRLNRAVSTMCKEIKYTYVFLEKASSTMARNIGIVNAEHDILVFMDDDVEVNQYTLEGISSVMKRPDMAMLGVLDETLPPASGFFGYLFNLKSLVNRKIGHVTLSMHGRYPNKIVGEIPTMWAMGFCFVVKKSLLERWKIRFDEKLTGYAYAEDLDFSFSYYKHAKKEKKKCIISEYVTVKHMESKEYRIPQRSTTYRYVINRSYLAYKHGMKLRNRCALIWANFGQFLLRCVQRSNPMDVWNAQKRCTMLNKYLKRGIIDASFYDSEFDVIKFGKRIGQ